MRLTLFFLSIFLMCSMDAFASATSTPVNEQTAFIFNSFLFLFGGVLVMFMAAGFAMLEVGMVRSTSAATILLKNIALYSIAGIMFYLVGYNLMYMGVDGGYIGTFKLWAADNSSIADGDFSNGYSPASDWFFQMVFVATAASVVSGTLAERIKLWPFLIFVIVLTGFIYPITGSWKWGTGWLDAMGFQDFAGSTLVHAVGGWAALTGAIILGPRNGKYGQKGQLHPMLASNLPLATLGTFILWMGWFGFNGASQLAMGSAVDVDAISTIFVNTNMAAAAGVVVAMLLTQLRYGKVDLSMTLNGALAGLVSITAEPLTPAIWQAMLIGAAGSAIMVWFVPKLDSWKIDDVVGAIPVHLVCGIWGTMAVPLTNSDATFLHQLIGVASISAFVVVTSTLIWFALKKTVGIRMADDVQRRGVDAYEMGIDAYPDFQRTFR